MKTRLLFALIAVAVIAAGVIWYLKRPAKNPTGGPTNLAAFHADGEKTFKWGVGVNDYPTNVIKPDVPQKVLDDAVKLGVSWVRLGLIGWQDDQLTLVDHTVDEALQRNLHVALGFDPLERIIDVKNPYDDGYSRGKQLATRYKDKVRYYQISNEIGSNAIKPSWPGDTIQSYDPKLYQQVLQWGKGAADGVRAADPNAKRIFTGNWITYGFFDQAIKDGLQFEVLGWDWYGGADHQYDLSKVNANNTTLDLAAKLKSYGKELWITEAGAEEGSLHGEARQAKSIENFATYVANSKIFNGFFPFRLHDEAHKFGTNEVNLGLVYLKRDETGTFQLGDPKAAFTTYQQLIKRFKTLPAVK